MPPTPRSVSADQARTLLMDAQGLLEDPTRRATPKAVERMIGRLGFVQVDSINVVERAHHLTLATRFHGYRHRHLTELLERRRRLFEHWTHDAAVIPIELYPQWKRRFRDVQASPRFARWTRRKLGTEPDKVIRRVHGRIRREGPLLAADFEPQEERAATSGFWNWTAEKTALEALWRTGKLAIRERRNFHKVYDLSNRVLPDACREPCPSRAAHVDWACGAALERLGVATPTELARYWDGIAVADARAWCTRAVKRGDALPVRVEAADGTPPRDAYATPDLDRRLARAPAPPPGLRLLAPFDPVIRDRERLRRLFGFDYRFEAFVPAAKRVHGYYVLPVLEGERFVARLDPKLHREEERLEVRALHWEPTTPATPARRRGLEQAVGRLAELVGAKRVDWPA